MGQWVVINMFPKMESMWPLWGAAYSELELGPFLRPPKVSTTFTNLMIKLVNNRALEENISPPDVLDPPLSAPSLLFLLLASLDLRGLASDLENSK